MVINQFTPFNLAVNLFGLIYERKAEHFISSGTFLLGAPRLNQLTRSRTMEKVNVVSVREQNESRNKSQPPY